MDDNKEEMDALKRQVRVILNMAAARGEIDGHEALRVVLDLAAEMISKVRDDDDRAGFVDAVLVGLPLVVESVRQNTKGMTRQ